MRGILSERSRNAPLAQLDRVSGYGPEGRGFESLKACQNTEITFGWSPYFHTQRGFEPEGTWQGAGGALQPEVARPAGRVESLKAWHGGSAILFGSAVFTASSRSKARRSSTSVLARSLFLCRVAFFRGIGYTDVLETAASPLRRVRVGVTAVASAESCTSPIAFAAVSLFSHGVMEGVRRSSVFLIAENA